MRLKKGLVTGLALASLFTPSCNITDDKPVQKAPTEVLELYDPSISLIAGTGSIQSDDASISEEPEARAIVKAIGKNNEKMQLDSVNWNAAIYGPIDITWLDIRAEKGFYNNTVASQSVISYKEVPVGTGWTIKLDAGTHRLKLEVNYAGKKIETQSKIHERKNGAMPGVRTIAVREGNDLPGQMTAWENLPYIYGSSDEQVENFVGGDCADVIVGALHRMGRHDIPYTYSQGFYKFGNVIFSGYIDMRGQFLDMSKRPVNSLGIERGDLLVYKAPQHHVGVFYDNLQKAGDPIRVVQTYDEKGVHVSQMYSGSQSQSSTLLNQFSKLFGFKPKEMPLDPKLDRVDVLRLR